MTKEEYDKLSGEVIGAAIEVHKHLGPGLLEHVYKLALGHELTLRGYRAEIEDEVQINYKGLELETNLRADLIVEDSIIVELKATEYDNPLYAAQLLTYLRLSKRKLGLLINFNRKKLVSGIERVVNGLY